MMKKLLIVAVMVAFFAKVSYSQEKKDISKIILLINEEKYQEALTILTTLPESTDKKLLLAIIELQTEKYDEAEKLLKEIIEELPELVPARYNLAMLYEKKKQYKEAISEWEKVFELSKDKSIRSLSIKHIRQLRGVIK
ncbi:MAG: tetratricopeptide repeat protein [Elusimicrobiota bacterium]|nr:tetratricopeptide repeat protein [Elusimicrobiota bacterium]